MMYGVVPNESHFVDLKIGGLEKSGVLMVIWPHVNLGVIIKYFGGIYYTGHILLV